MSKMSRDKGKRGERIVIDWLQPIVDAECKAAGVKRVLLQRNTIQSDCGGSDIVGLYWLAAEVKNCERQGPSDFEAWWKQCHEQATEGQTPVLFYTRAHQPVRVRLMGWIGGHVSCCDEPLESDLGLPALVDIGAEQFEAWFRARLGKALKQKLGFKPKYQGEWKG